MTSPQKSVNRQFVDRLISVKDFKEMRTYRLVMNSLLCSRGLLLLSIFFDFWKIFTLHH